MLTKHRARSGFVSLVVGVLCIARVTGPVAAGEADAAKEHNIQAPASDTDYSNVEEYKLQTPRPQLQTDQAMEQSSKALQEAIKQPRKDDR